MNFDDAMQIHGHWRVKLRAAIADRERLDAEAITRDDCCVLGQWLYGEAQEKYGWLSGYSTCVEKHARFHVEAGKVALVINAGDYEEAEKLLSMASDYADASGQLTSALMRLKRQANP